MPSIFTTTTFQRTRDRFSPLMLLACITLLSMLAFYVQVLHSAVQHGEQLKLQRCKAAMVTGYVPRHCRV